MKRVFKQAFSSHWQQLLDYRVINKKMTEGKNPIKSCLKPILCSLKFLRIFGAFPLNICFEEDQTKVYCHILFQVSFADAFPVFCSSTFCDPSSYFLYNFD